MFYIFSCTQTITLYNIYKKDYDVFIPVERCRTSKGIVKRAAIGGLFFAGASAIPGLKEEVPSWYRLKQEFNHVGKPWTVAREEVYRVQEVLNAEFEGREQKEVLPEYNPGDPVTVLITDCCQVQGTVTKLKTDGRVRIRGPLGYMDVAPSRIKLGLYAE